MGIHFLWMLNFMEKLDFSTQYEYKDGIKLQEYQKELNIIHKNLNVLINKIKQKINGFVNFSDDSIYMKFMAVVIYEIIPYLRPETILAEYRNLRLSIENNRTYVEASELYKIEMELRKEISLKKLKEKFPKLKLKIITILSAISVLFIGLLYTLLITTIIFTIILLKNKNKMENYKIIVEGIIIYFYGILSDYGESILKPMLISTFLIFFFPFIVPILDFNGILFEVNPLNIGNLVSYLMNIQKCYYNMILNYNELLEQTLRAFFQLGIKDENSPMYSYEWLIRIVSLILLGSLLIAIKRRLERK